jgi:hypothetical protein
MKGMRFTWTAALLGALTGGCTEAPRPGSGPVDSAAAVARALTAPSCGAKPRYSQRASRVTRDSTGFLVETQPVAPPGVDILGGRALVHVDSATGEVRGVQCFQ